MQSSDQFKQAVENYLAGNASKSEKQLVDEWYHSFDDKKVEVTTNTPDSFDIVEARIKERILNSLELTEVREAKTIRLWPRLSVVASIILCVGIGTYFYQRNNDTTPIADLQNDIAPGGNKAFLTLADGKRIALTNAKNGELAEQSGVKITKAADGQLIYTVSDASKKNNEVKEYNTIETPNGGQYQIILPDGTKVWLNAASSLKYPSSFARLVNRKVELLGGEAYFEVAKDKKHPFIVKSNGQEVEVLGTHFNINNYSDESFTKTTLLEGSVRISPISNDGTKYNSTVLRPNEQALLRGKAITVTDADTEEAVAWKKGYFKFQDESIESVMRKVARWYNIKVQYSGPMPSQGLEGTMSREQNLSEVLKKLQTTGLVKFEINGNTVIVNN